MDIKMDVNGLAKQLGDALQPLADKLSTSAGHVYLLAVKDVFISGIYEAVVCGLLFVGFLAALYLFAHGINSDSEGELGFGGILSFFFLAIFLTILGPCIHDLGNPEYQAILSMLHAVKGN